MPYRWWNAPIACLVVAVGCGSTGGSGPGYTQTNLVSNVIGKAPVADGHLVNAWGIAHSGSSPWWVANNHTGTSTLYTGTGSPYPLPTPPASPLVVTIPPAVDSPPDTLGSPTGIVFNSSLDFIVSGAGSGPAQFIFAT